MNSGDYWKKRAEELEKITYQDAMTTADLVSGQMKTAEHEINKQIESWYAKFAKNNEISLADAKRILTAGELKEFQWDVEEYIKRGEQIGLHPEWITQMRNASAKHHIERLEALKIHMQQSCEIIAAQEDTAITGLVKKAYTDRYYHETFEIQKGIGTGWAVNQVKEKELETVIKKPWAPDGADFSSRIWKNKDKLVNTLHTEITQGCITGRPLEEVTKRISQTMNTSAYNARRLAQTESAHFAAAADQQSYIDTGTKQYQILATLDDRTSEICQDMDGQVFKTEEYSEGVTAPPFHANCRSTTVPYFDDFTEDEMRAARGEDGKTYEVPASMKYEDWKESFVSEHEEGNRGIARSLIVSNYIDSSEYRDKFDKLGENSTVTREAYSKSKIMLRHRSGTAFEDMTFINSLTGKALTQNSYEVESQVIPTKKMKEMIKASEPYTIISIHTHSGSNLPSYTDLLTAQKRRYKYGVVTCHNGVIFKYTVNQQANIVEADYLLEKLQQILYNKDENNSELLDRLHKCGVDLEII